MRRLILTLAACAGGWWLGSAAPGWLVGLVCGLCAAGLAALVLLPDPLRWLDDDEGDEDDEEDKYEGRAAA